MAKLKHKWTAPKGDGSGDLVMAIQGSLAAVKKGTAGMSNVRSVTQDGDLVKVRFSGRFDDVMEMFETISKRAG